jgi:hypothetical protein
MLFYSQASSGVRVIMLAPTVEHVPAVPLCAGPSDGVVNSQEERLKELVQLATILNKVGCRRWISDSSDQDAAWMSTCVKLMDDFNGWASDQDIPADSLLRECPPMKVPGYDIPIVVSPDPPHFVKGMWRLIVRGGTVLVIGESAATPKSLIDVRLLSLPR